MIVGTAGHIDHGKTTLVKALTGVDTDRLPEEKRRGISIELGYAFLDVPGRAERIGFIDVPGHERLVHTMVAGATGIDFALLLVAADDGVMPQTREHLAVLSLLGIGRGAVVITKTDCVEPTRLAAVTVEVAVLLQGTALAGAPVVRVSAVRGDGIDALRALLFDAACATRANERRDVGFRLAIDRAFTLDGVGTIVTGTVHAGRVGTGDTLAWAPATDATTVRVRGVHAQNRAVAQAQAGDRCALALGGTARDRIERGQWLVTPAVSVSTNRIDACVTLWPAEARALRSGDKVNVHLASTSVQASIAVLDGSPANAALSPGETGRVQLVLNRPIGAWRRDRFVLRDAAASRTIAGGYVLDPFAPVRYRRTPQRLAELNAVGAPSPQQRLQALIAVASQGVDLHRFAAVEGLTETSMLAAALPHAVLHHQDSHGEHVLGERQHVAARAAILHALSGFHERNPDELGPDLARLRRLSCPRFPEPLWNAMLELLKAEGAVSLRASFVHLPAHVARLGAIDERIAAKVAPHLAQAGFEGAWARDLARDTAEPEPLMRVTLARLAKRGDVHQVVRDLYYPHAAMARLAAIARDAASTNRDCAITAAAFRDASGLGRKRAIQVLEYLDRIGLLRRVGDAHRLRSDSSLFMGGGP